MAMVRTIDNWIWRCSLLRNDFVISNQCSQCNSLLSLAESKQINETLVKDSSLLWEKKLKKNFLKIFWCCFVFLNFNVLKLMSVFYVFWINLILILQATYHLLLVLSNWYGIGTNLKLVSTIYVIENFSYKID